MDEQRRHGLKLKEGIGAAAEEFGEEGVSSLAGSGV